LSEWSSLTLGYLKRNISGPTKLVLDNEQIFPMAFNAHCININSTTINL